MTARCRRGAIGPSMPASSIATTGPIVMKIAANSIATSAIGCHVKSLDCRIARGVMAAEVRVIPSSTTTPAS